MTCSTLWRVSALTRLEPLRTSDTVDFDTPAARAISTIVTGRPEPVLGSPIGASPRLRCYRRRPPNRRVLYDLCSKPSIWNVLISTSGPNAHGCQVPRAGPLRGAADDAKAKRAGIAEGIEGGLRRDFEGGLAGR